MTRKLLKAGGKLHLYHTYDGPRHFAPNIRSYHALMTKGIEAYRPMLPRTVRECRRILGDAREAAAR